MSRAWPYIMRGAEFDLEAGVVKLDDAARKNPLYEELIALSDPRELSVRPWKGGDLLPSLPIRNRDMSAKGLFTRRSHKK